MKTILRLCMILTVMGSAQASNSKVVSTVVENSCLFESPGFVAVINPVVGFYDVGELEVACNYVGVFDVVLSVASSGTSLINGSSRVLYAIAWDIEPEGLVYRGSGSNGATHFEEGFPVDTGASPSSPVSGRIWVHLKQTPTVVGTYTGVATYTISP